MEIEERGGISKRNAFTPRSSQKKEEEGEPRKSDWKVARSSRRKRGTATTTEPDVGFIAAPFDWDPFPPRIFFFAFVEHCSVSKSRDSHRAHYVDAEAPSRILKPCLSFGS